MNSVFFIVLRRMRAPLIALVAIFSVSVLGLTLVPGVDAAGLPTPPMSFFHAFYFISYTATTIGFGEIPAAFSDAQRMWVTVCIYLTVVGWSYSILTLLALLQDKGFQNTLVTSRFARRVRRTRLPFYLVCGCGETGGLICHTLDRLGHGFVVLEKNEVRVQELDLEDFKTDIPALAADATQPANLQLAGLNHPKCQGVLAMTDEEESNLAIAIAVRLLNPAVPVLARARSERVMANMGAFDTDHVISPFERFAEYLALAMSAPGRFRLIEILTGLPGGPLPAIHRPPGGKWIVCGYGVFGQAIIRHLAATGNRLTVVAPEADSHAGQRCVRGEGTDAATLLKAGVKEASGLVAGTGKDVDNLSMAMTARQLNPELFIVTRQNQSANGVLFDAFNADFGMVPSRIVAQECIAILTTPLLSRFLEALRNADEGWCEQLADRLEKEGAGQVPEVWSVRLDASDAAAVHATLLARSALTVEQLLRDSADWGVPLPIVPLMIERAGQSRLLPDAGFPLMPADRLLLAGRHEARAALELTLQNAHALDNVLHGRERSGGWLWRRWFAGPAD